MIGDESPRETVRRVLSAWNTGDPGFVHRYYAKDFTFESSTGEVVDRAGYRAIVEGVQDALDGLTVEPHYVIGGDDRVAVRVTLSGTHVGELRGVEATGKAVSFDSVFVYRIEDGQIVREEHFTDNLGLLEQLGADPGDD